VAKYNKICEQGGQLAAQKLLVVYERIFLAGVSTFVHLRP